MNVEKSWLVNQWHNHMPQNTPIINKRLFVQNKFNL
jgi:hypothetical protein